MATLESLVFDNTLARLGPPFVEAATPTPLPNLRLLHLNRRACALIDLDPAEGARPDFAEHFGGALLPRGAEPVAMRYAGHQSGVWVPQLGDGRAILLGEVRNRAGEKWDLHLKGSGPTVFSRGFDGRAVLRSSIREYLAGEALAGLGIPTTRALCLTVSDAPVVREQVESAATIVRLSPTHVRFGTFEYFASRGDAERLRRLADHVITFQFPDLIGQPDRVVAMYGEVVERTARLVAQWQAAGFAHGVLNTDNMSIAGLTLDYGPYGFLDTYADNFICNHSDHDGRYAFGQQPAIGQWNCAALGRALLPLMETNDAVAALERYAPRFEEHYAALMRAKLGLLHPADDDLELIGQLLAVLEAGRVDYARFFRRLGDLTRADLASDTVVLHLSQAPDTLAPWLERYRARLDAEQRPDAERAEAMRRVNPAYVLRNWVAQEAITEAQEHGRTTILDTLLELLADPFTERPGQERWMEPPPDWARELVVSCSS